MLLGGVLAVQWPKQEGVFIFVAHSFTSCLTVAGCLCTTDGTFGDAFLTLIEALIQ